MYVQNSFESALRPHARADAHARARASVMLQTSWMCDARERTRRSRGLGATIPAIEFLCYHVNQTALAGFATEGNRSFVVQRRSTVRRRDRSRCSRSGASGLGKRANKSKERNVLVINVFSLFQRDHVRVQGYEHIPIGKTVSDVS